MPLDGNLHSGNSQTSELSSPSLSTLDESSPTIHQTIIDFNTIEFQSGDEDVVRCVKGRVPVFRKNDMDTMVKYMVKLGLYGLPECDQATLAQITLNDGHIHLINDEVGQIFLILRLVLMFNYRGRLLAHSKTAISRASLYGYIRGSSP